MKVNEANSTGSDMAFRMNSHPPPRRPSDALSANFNLSQKLDRLEGSNDDG
jgi:hypothetical protein